MAPKNRAPKNDKEQTNEDFANYYSFGINQMMEYGGPPVIPTPTYEPAVPSEVFYERLSHDPDFDSSELY